MCILPLVTTEPARYRANCMDAGATLKVCTEFWYHLQSAELLRLFCCLVNEADAVTHQLL